MRDCETCKHYVVVENRHDRETTKSCECWECNYERGMTESEAIKALRLEGSIEISGKSTRVSEFVQALDIAINALEKQIPKKPIKVGSGVHDYDYDYECPMCRENIDEDEHHCKCGQKLDWESD